MVEAINAVVAEFACILVITDAVVGRDRGGGRIEVEKTAAGSTLSLVAV